MGKVENLLGKKQAPLAMMGTVAFMPFQIQESEERGEERRLPYLMYLFWKRETQELLWLVRRFQPSFAMREKLTSFIRRNPKPP